MIISATYWVISATYWVISAIVRWTKLTHCTILDITIEVLYLTGDENEEDNMNDWDEEKLEEVINKKHGESNKAKPQTSIVSMPTHDEFLR